MTDKQFFEGLNRLQDKMIDGTRFDEYLDEAEEFLADVLEGSTIEQLEIRKPLMLKLIKTQGAFIHGVFEERLNDGSIERLLRMTDTEFTECMQRLQGMARQPDLIDEYFEYASTLKTRIERGSTDQEKEERLKLFLQAAVMQTFYVMRLEYDRAKEGLERGEKN